MARVLILVGVCLVLLVDAASVRAEGSQIIGLEQADLQLSGRVDPSSSLWSVAAVGDVNGDGYGDLAIGTGGDAGGRSTARYAYVIFMRPSLRSLDLAHPGEHGFRVLVPGGGDDPPYLMVARAGDVNGDGLGDIVVGNLTADPAGRPDAGAAYVVFGKQNSGDVSVDALGTDGFSILGTAIAGAFSGNLGASVAGVGDMNGDGLDDVAVTEPGTNEIWVVKGAASTAAVDLRAPQGRAFVLAAGARPGDLAAIGDVNGDGVPDVAYGNYPYIDCCHQTSEVDVAFGSNDGFPAGGFRIVTAVPNVLRGVVAPAGDVNGDGRADLLVSAGVADTHGPFTGAAYVVFGKSSAAAVDVGALGSAGYRMDGAAAGDRFGVSLAPAGDVNGDGRADVVVGSVASNNGRAQSGSVYVIPGKADSQPIDLAEPGAALLRIDGAAADDQSGSFVAAGDLNGDAISDYIIGTPTSETYGNWFVSVVLARLADTVAPTTTDDADAGWHNAAVTVHLAAADNEGGSAVAATYNSLDGGPQRQGTSVLVAAPADHTNDGVHTITYYSVDNAGNSEAARAANVKIDTTAPTISATRTPAANASGWSSRTVTLSFSCADSGSGIASCPPDRIVGEGADQSATGVASDSAGNTASATVADINVDLHPPVVAYSGNDGSYSVDQTVAIACTATDALSGVASSSCGDLIGPAYAFGLGTITRSASATDLAGNTGDASTTFTVTVDATSLCSLARAFSANTGVAAAVCAKIAAIASAPNATAKAGLLDSFRKELDAQVGKALTATQAAVLKQLAANL